MSQDPPTPIPTPEEFAAQQKEKQAQAARLHAALQTARILVYERIGPISTKRRLLSSTAIRGF